jgi:hypothetical protein
MSSSVVGVEYREGKVGVVMQSALSVKRKHRSTSGTYKSTYTQHTLQQGLHMIIEEHISINEASQRYHIPRRTLGDYYRRYKQFTFPSSRPSVCPSFIPSS